MSTAKAVSIATPTNPSACTSPFDVHDGSFTRDDDGGELDGIDAARKQVWNTLPAMAAHREADGDMACQLRMAVQDESDK